MSHKGLLEKKSYNFALLIIQIVRKVQTTQREYLLTKQLLRSATSIDANAEEASAGQSKKDFIAKLSIASKEARESHYWLRLMIDSKTIEKDISLRLLQDCEELIKILTASVKTAQRNLKMSAEPVL